MITYKIVAIKSKIVSRTHTQAHGDRSSNKFPKPSEHRYHLIFLRFHLYDHRTCIICLIFDLHDLVDPSESRSCYHYYHKKHFFLRCFIRLVPFIHNMNATLNLNKLYSGDRVMTIPTFQSHNLAVFPKSPVVVDVYLASCSDKCALRLQIFKK